MVGAGFAEDDWSTALDKQGTIQYMDQLAVVVSSYVIMTSLIKSYTYVKTVKQIGSLNQSYYLFRNYSVAEDCIIG